MIVPDGPVSAGSRKCAAPPHLCGHRASGKYLQCKHITQTRIAEQAFLHEKYISSGGKYAKVKSKVETKYDTECKSQAPPPPQDSGCQDRVLLCYAAGARFLLVVPGSWSLVPGNPHIIGHHLRTITQTSAPNCPECPAPAHALPQLKMKRR